MKTKKSIWSIALGLIVILALVLSFGLSSQRATVKAEEPVDHITFNVTVDGFNEKTIESNHSNLLVVRYTVTENTGVDAMQLRIDFSSAFTLERIEALKTTSLGEPTINNGTAVEPLNGENYVAYENITLEENNIYIGANIVYEHVNNRYSATGDTLIIAYYRLNNNPTEGVYPFGFWNANNGDGFSTAWKNVANAEQSGTHTPVIINYADAVVYIMGDYEFTLTNGQKVYDGAPAENSEITVNDNENENRPTLNYVWFEGISSNSNTYRKLDSNPVNAGQYFVVLEYQATNRYRAYSGYTETAEPGVYTLDSTQGHVATYIITQRSITITATAQSADYTGIEPTVNQNAYTVVDNEDVKLENIASLVSGVNISKVEGVNAGNYTLTPSLENSNYNITFVDGTFTINPKEITIKIDDKSSKYGAPLAELTWALKSGSSLAGNDTLAGLHVELSTTPADLSNANVGTYPISGTYNNGNYAVIWENGTYTIESVGKDAEYIFSFIEGLTKNYNGSVQDLLSILAQNANEEAKPAWISYTVSNNQQKNAGDYVIPVSVTLSQEVADNYTNGVKEFATTVNGKINKIALTITASGNVQYSDALPAITIDNGNGWVANENYATYNTSVEALEEYVDSTYASTMTAGTHYAVTWYSDAKDDIEEILTNYNVTLVGADCVVAKKVLNAADYAFAGYTGTYNATNHTLAVTGNLDLVNVTISSKATVKDVEDSGNYTATIALKDAANYTFENGTHTGWTVADGYASASKQAQVTISPKQLEISVNYTDSKTATFSLSGFAGEETEAVLTGLVYKADGAVSANISGNVYTISEYVANAIAISAESSNGNYSFAPATLRNIRKVEYAAGSYDAEKAGMTPVLPTTELLFNGFTATKPADVALNHYTFVRFATDANNSAAFNFAQAIAENKVVYAIWEENNKYTITLYYMVDGDAQNLYDVDELEFYSDVLVRYGHELPSMTAKDWFKVQEWYTDAALTTKYVEGTLSADTTLYANYKFNIGLGDVNADGYVDANDITLYRQWIVGGYGEIKVEDGAEWALVNSDAYTANKASEAPKAYFVIRVADSNALTAESTVLGDAHFDIRDVSTIRMGLVGGYGFAIVEGKTVDGEALLVTRTVTIDSVSDLLAVARSGRAVQLAGDITEENFVGAIVDCGNDVVIDLNNHTITVKSLSISLAANNTGKIEIKNGRINVADGNGVHLSAPAGSIVLDDVTLYDRDGIFELQAANHSLHFNNVVKFLKDEQGVEAPAAVKVENGTHVVVEEAAEVTVEKLVVTQSFVPAQEASDAKITIDVESVVPQEIVVDGYVEIEEGAEQYVKPTYLEVATNAEFIAAAHQTDIKVIKLTEDLVDLGTVTFVGNVTIEGNGHIISGNSALILNKLGAKVSNVKFQNIHNSESKLTPIYGTNLEGKLEIENCEFNTVDWDAIQITPVAGAEVVIKNNIFRHSGENAVNTRRYVHIQSATNVDFAATIENNKFYNVEYLRDTAIEVYYPTNESKVVILNNYVDAPVGVCILKNSGANAWYLANSFVEEDLETAVVMKAAIVETYNAYFFRTLQAAVDFAGQNQTTITLIDDASGDGVVVAENQNITFDFNGHTYIVNGALVGSTGTKTLGFQLLKGANVTFKNGTLKTVNAKMLIQNYANTTLDNFTVSGEGATQLQYVTSNNFGSMTVKAGSKILADNNQVAFDLWYGLASDGSYDAGVTVTLKAGSQVVGKVEYGAQRQIAGWTDKTKLIVEDGAVWDGVVTLSSNITTSRMYFNYNAKLDLNGKTITGRFTVEEGNVTLDNGKIIGRVDAYDNAVLTLGENLVVENSNDAAVVIWGDTNKNPQLHVYGTVKAYNDNFAITGNGTDSSSSVCYIYAGAEVLSDADVAIYWPQAGTLNIKSGATVTGATAVYIKSGAINVEENANITSNMSEKVAYAYNGDGAYATGDAIIIDNCGYPNGNAVVNISGDYDVAIYWYVGTEQQLRNALAVGGNIILKNDILVTGTTAADRLTITVNTNLNLNGKTLKSADGLEPTDNWSTLWVNNGAVANISNGTIGSCYDSDGVTDAPYGITVGQKDGTAGTVNLTNVNVNGGTSAVYVIKGEANIYSGTYEVSPYVEGTNIEYEYALNCYDPNYKAGIAVINVYGGAFKNFNPANCQAEGLETKFVAEGYGVEQDGDYYVVTEETQTGTIETPQGPENNDEF